jgi:RNA polymerase sigma-70 factor (ECF subfamily)
LGNTVDADEAAQATFVRAFERLEQCEGQRRFGPWVHVIAHRLCVDTVRARARTQPEEVPVPVDEPSPGPGNPEESVLDQERVRQLREALAMLSDRQRDAVVARTLDERGPGEIAAQLGLSVGAVDSLLLRGRRRLARMYRRFGD